MGYSFHESVKEVDGKTLFRKERLQDIVYDGDGEGADDWEDSFVVELAEVIVSKITDTSRWSTHHYCVFKQGGRYYSTEYSRGATESQPEEPYEYEGEWVEVTEVAPVPVTVTKYEPILERGNHAMDIISGDTFFLTGNAPAHIADDYVKIIAPAVRTASGWHEIKSESEAV